VELNFYSNLKGLKIVLKFADGLIQVNPSAFFLCRALNPDYAMDSVGMSFASIIRRRSMPPPEELSVLRLLSVGIIPHVV
jgi:hypothetical protein